MCQFIPRLLTVTIWVYLHTQIFLSNPLGYIDLVIVFS
jgi:hypothetical protein